MSTYLYLECADHDPPIKSNGEVGQHLSDVPHIQENLNNREIFIANRERDLIAEYRDFFTTNTAYFLCAHPKCRIVIRDEYGEEHGGIAAIPS
ncbi:hypothetical protein HWC80_gp082 [Mycobacterium phage Indlulamithi]|uniref:Uncharacterized protein n=1 Tax=Mycobacterium phage Indlulamithi TaxID=2656582 RepID=A0A649VCQ0_9CAUD|nr:hypothetical protein HWC80_gp082 [Mycobacterium phage Indlulamithi]QGJ90130.1 hypothetical protein PBI_INDLULAMITHI_92 [Mycobacterium phage Indlulamithi]